jgi:hypothetical protein
LLHKAEDKCIRVSPDTEVLLVAVSRGRTIGDEMKLLITTILIFSFVAAADNRAADSKEVKYDHDIEIVGTLDWIDSVTISPDTYIDVRYDYNPGGIGITMLDCRANGVKCDSPSEFRRMVGQMTRAIVRYDSGGRR